MHRHAHNSRRQPSWTVPIRGIAQLATQMFAGLAAERGRWPLWLPVGFAAGICLYFMLPEEPPFWSGAAAVLALLLATAVCGAEFRVLPVACLSLAIGFLAMQVRTATVTTPVLQADLDRVHVTGTVTSVEQLDGGIRVILSATMVSGLGTEGTPARIRLRFRSLDRIPQPGMRIRVLASLQAPSGPVEPGAFDFRRHAFFQSIGAVGFAYRRWELMPPLAPNLWERVNTRFEAARQYIADQVQRRLDGASAGVATALLTGEVTAIPEADLEAMRLSGLQHLLSISGLHVGLVAGLVFFTLRALLALVPPIALHFPIKKWAALAAMAAILSYMALVGAPVPTQRSVIMTGLMLTAILVDRSPFSLRIIMLAAAVVLLLQPEALLGPSFQMSFGAVTALIGTYDALAPRLSVWKADAGPVRRGALYVLGLVLTSLVAGTATMPFALYHFQQVANYGVLANLVAVPVTSFWIMPWGLLVYGLMPFGLEGWAVSAMGVGADVILATARFVAGLAGASLQVPAAPGWALAAVSLGGLWLLLWSGPIRWLGLSGVVVFTGALLWPDLPLIRVDAEGRVIAIRAADGRLLVSTRRAGRFDSDEWQQRDGLAGKPLVWLKAGSRDGVVRCGEGACLYQPPDTPLTVLLQSKPGRPEHCPAVDLVIALRGAMPCPAGTMITADDLAARGAHSLFLRGQDLVVKTTRPHPGARPWS